MSAEPNQKQKKASEKFRRDPLVISVLEKTFIAGCTFKLVCLLPKLSQEASQAEETYKAAVEAIQNIEPGSEAAAYAGLAKDLFNSANIDKFATDFVGVAADRHFDGAIDAFKESNDALPIFRGIVTAYAKVFAAGISVLAQAITAGAFEFLGTQGVLMLANEMGEVLAIAGNIVSEVIGEAQQELCVELMGGALPVAGACLATWRLGRGVSQCAKSGAKGIKGAWLQRCGKDERATGRGRNLRLESRSYCKEGCARSHAGILGFVGQIPGMCILTVPLTIFCNRVANKEFIKRTEYQKYVKCGDKVVICDQKTLDKMAVHLKD
ncbi:hypothetical protein ACA910_014295 [Epithemia clementina (nom. ined.)]